jgi:hypothetical protein
VKAPSLIVLNGFLEDYNKHRSVAPSKSWGSTLSSIASVLSSPVLDKATKIENILQTWERLTDSFSKTYHQKDPKLTAAQWVDIMLDLGNTAYVFQLSSIKRSRSSAVLHAMRAYIYVALNESDEGKEAIKAKIAKLETELVTIAKTKSSIPQDAPDIKNRNKTADEDHNKTLRGLAFLNVNKTRDRIELASIFPKYDFPPEITQNSLPSFSQSNGITLNQNLPYILHEMYTTIYINKIDDPEKQTDDVTFISLEDYVKQRTQKFNYKYGLDLFPIAANDTSHTHLIGVKPFLSSTAGLASTMKLPISSPAAESEHKDSAQSHHPLPSNDSVVSKPDSAASSPVPPIPAASTPSLS